MRVPKEQSETGRFKKEKKKKEKKVTKLCFVCLGLNVGQKRKTQQRNIWFYNNIKYAFKQAIYQRFSPKYYLLRKRLFEQTKWQT